MRNILERFWILFSILVPTGYKEELERTIKYAGRDEDFRAVSGFSMAIGLILLGVFVYLAYAPFEVTFTSSILVRKVVFISVGVLLLLLAHFAYYAYFFFLAERRTSQVEKVLPDALSLIASNLSSGLTPYHAVKTSIRPDFGPLGVAFEVATNKSLGTKSFNTSLMEMSENIRSDVLARSMKLFASAISAGSNVASLLEHLAQDIVDRRSLKSDLVTSTQMNSMFVMFMVIVGAPILMAISIFFVDTVSNIQTTSGLDPTTAQQFDISLGGEIAITTGFLTGYAFIILFVTGVLASYFGAVMIEGNGLVGLRTSPFIIAGSYVVFFIARYFVNNMLGGFF